MRVNAALDAAYASPQPPSPAGAGGSMAAVADVMFTITPRVPSGVARLTEHVRQHLLRRARAG